MAELVSHRSLQRRDWLGLFFILLLAAGLRLITVQYNHFLSDEADLSLLAQGIATGVGRPLLGITSSAGIQNSPVGEYMVAVPFFFSSDPAVATSFVALWNVLGVGLLWWLACRILNPTAAFIAGVIYAVSPWAVWYSSKIWIQNLHTPLVLLSLLLGISGFIEGRRWAQLFFLPVFILALQIHFATWALLPLFPVLVWMGRRRLFWPVLAVSLVLAGLLLYPFLVGLERTGTAMQIGTGTVSHLASNLTNLHLEPLLYNAWLSTGLGMTSVISYYMAKQMTASLPTLPLLWALLGLAAASGLFIVWKKVRREFALLICLWALLPVVVFMLPLPNVVEHYFVASIPAWCLLAALSLIWLLDRLSNTTMVRVVIGGVLGIILLTQILWWRGLLQYIDITPLPEQGTPLHYLMDVRQALAKSDDILITLSGSKVTQASYWQALLFRSAECIRLPVVEKPDMGAALLPKPSFAVLAAPDNPEPVLNGLYVSPQKTQVPIRPGEGAFTIYAFDQRPAWNGPTLRPVTPAHFDNDIQLTGYQFQDNRLYLRWDVDKQPGRDYQYFVHLLNTAGEKLGQRDVALYDHRSLCAGDQVITWLDLPRPAGAVLLRVGMYTFDESLHYLNSAIVDEHGNRGLPWVDIPLE